MNDAGEISRPVFDDDDEESYEIIPRVPSERERAEMVIEVAEKGNADHVFSLVQKRSPTGKALFGDLAQ